jgi:hypothetical protein
MGETRTSDENNKDEDNNDEEEDKDKEYSNNKDNEYSNNKDHDDGKKDHDNDNVEKAIADKDNKCKRDDGKEMDQGQTGCRGTSASIENSESTLRG